MSRGAGWMMGVWGVLLTLGGCTSALRDGCSLSAIVPPGRNPEALPVHERSAFPFDPNSSQRIALAAPIEDERKDQLIYRRLQACACQCLAAEASSVANLLEQEGQVVLRQAEARKLCGEKGRHTAAVTARMLAYLAAEDRNRSAAKALDLYYRLGQAEAESDILQVTRAQVSNALSKARDLKACPSVLFIHFA